MKMTIQKFQQLFQIQNQQMDELDKAIMLVQVFADKSEFAVSKLKTSEFNKLCRKINKSFEGFDKELINGKPKNIIKANGKWYFLNMDIEQLNAGRYVEMATYCKDVIPNLHMILATMCTPMAWSWNGLKIKKFKAEDHSKYADDFLQADFNVAYQCAVFFYAVLFKSMESSLSSLKNQEGIKVEVLQRILEKSLDGFIQPKWYQNLKLSV